LEGIVIAVRYCSIQEPGQIVCLQRLHPSGISIIVQGFKYTELKLLSNCTDVEKEVGEEMIHLLGGIIKNDPLLE
jgi:hypothetical protein